MEIDADPFADLFGASAAPLDALFPQSIDVFLDRIVDQLLAWGF